MLELDRIQLDKYFHGNKFQTPYIGNAKIPSPFTNFGKSLDGLLKNGGFHIDEEKFKFDMGWGFMQREYVKKNSSFKISYEHNVPFQVEVLPIPLSQDEIDWKDDLNFEISPGKFYQLFTNDKINVEKIWINTKNDTEIHFCEDENKSGLFSVEGMIDSKDLPYILPQRSLEENKNLSKRVVFDETYITKEEVLGYMSDFVSNLLKNKA